MRNAADWWRRLLRPVLYVDGNYDLTNITNGNRLGDPMRAACAVLTVISMPAAHWFPPELEAELVQAIRTWLHAKML